MLDKKECDEIIKEYCFVNGITDKEIIASIEINHINLNTEGNHVFSVTRLHGDKALRSVWTLEKTDLGYLSLQKCMAVPMDKDDSMEKHHVANWVRQQMRIRLMPSDINHIHKTKERYDVVISGDSMRFKGQFTIHRKQEI